MSANNKSVLEQANAAVTRGDYEGFLSFCTDDTLWTFVGDRVLKGKEDVRRWMAEAYSQGPPELTVDHLIAEGEFLTAVGVVTTSGQGREERSLRVLRRVAVPGGKLAELRAFVIEEKN